jgi:hypothetical protein
VSEDDSRQAQTQEVPDQHDEYCGMPANDSPQDENQASQHTKASCVRTSRRIQSGGEVNLAKMPELIDFARDAGIPLTPAVS